MVVVIVIIIIVVVIIIIFIIVISHNGTVQHQNICDIFSVHEIHILWQKS